MGAVIEELGPANVAAGVVLTVGLLVLALAVRALTNAALALRARLFALGSGLGLTALGLGKPLGLDRRLLEQVSVWLDTPLEQAAAVLALVLAVAILVSLVLAWLWLRAMMRLLWLAWVGASLLGTALLVILAGEGLVPVPAWLSDTSVLVAVIAGLLLVWGLVRSLRPAPKPTS